VHHLRRMRIPMPCRHEHVPILVGLRRGAVNTGECRTITAPNSSSRWNAGQTRSHQPTERDKFIEKQELKLFDGLRSMPGWLRRLRSQGREIVADFARVMNYLGTSYGVLRKENGTAIPSAVLATISCSNNSLKRTSRLSRK